MVEVVEIPAGLSRAQRQRGIAARLVPHLEPWLGEVLLRPDPETRGYLAG